MKTLEIQIKSQGEAHKDFIQVFKAVQSGKKLTPKGGVYFTSLDAVRNLLTQKRMELLHVIKEKHPKSILELSKMADREFKNVYDDIQIMKAYGLVKLTRKGRGKINSKNLNAITVPYQAINIHASI